MSKYFGRTKPGRSTWKDPIPTRKSLSANTFTLTLCLTSYRTGAFYTVSVSIFLMLIIFELRIKCLFSIVRSPREKILISGIGHINQRVKKLQFQVTPTKLWPDDKRDTIKEWLASLGLTNPDGGIISHLASATRLLIDVDCFCLQSGNTHGLLEARSMATRSLGCTQFWALRCHHVEDFHRVSFETKTWNVWPYGITRVQRFKNSIEASKGKIRQRITGKGRHLGLSRFQYLPMELLEVVLDHLSCKEIQGLRTALGISVAEPYWRRRAALFLVEVGEIEEDLDWRYLCVKWERLSNGKLFRDYDYNSYYSAWPSQANLHGELERKNFSKHGNRSSLNFRVDVQF